MKLHLNASFYRKLMSCFQAATIPLCVHAACAQDLTLVTIKEGEEETFTTVSDLENKHVVVDGSLTTAISGGVLNDAEITVSETGVVHNPGVLRTASNNQLTINVDGGRFYNDESNTNSISAQSSGAQVNINVNNGGYVENSSEMEAYVFSPYADDSKLQIMMSNGQLVNTSTGSLTSEGPRSLLSIALNERSSLVNDGEIVGAAGPVQIRVEGGELVNNGEIYSGLAVYDINLLLDIGISEGKIINNGFIGIVQWCDGVIVVGEGTVLENNGQIQSQSGACLTINVQGGDFNNNGGDSNWLGSSLESGGECDINVESGVFNNRDTVGNADVRVGTDGLMTGWGAFGSNEVMGKLVVGDGTPGLNHPAVKHQSYSGNVVFRDEAQLHFYIEGRDNYSQIFVGGQATGGEQITAAVEVTSQMMAQSVADGEAFMNPGYVVQVDDEGVEENVSAKLGIEYYGVGPFTSYYYVDPETGSLLPYPDDDPDDSGDTPGGDDPGSDPGDTPGDDDPGSDPGDTPGGDDPGSDPGDTPGGDDPGSNPGDTPDGDDPGSDEPMIEAVLSGTGDLANTLWSSAGTVRGFVRTALNQLTLPCYASQRSVVDDKSGRFTVVYPGNVVRCRNLNLWGAGFGDFINMGGTAAFSYEGGGYAIGADTAMGEHWRGGVAVGQSFGDFRAKHTGNDIDQSGVMFTVYSGYEKKISDKGSHRVSAYFAYGVVDNDARTNLLGVEMGHADWDDTVYTAGLEYALDFRVRENVLLSPFVGIEYLYGSQSVFVESFSGGMERRYDGAVIQTWRIPAGVKVRHCYVMDGNQYLVTDLALGYVGDVSRRNPGGHVNIAGRDFRIQGSNPGRNAFMLRLGTNWLIDDHWTVGAAYDLETRSRQTSQSVDAYVRYSF